MILTASALLRSKTSPSESDIRQAMQGNICRCGTYNRIVAAIQKAVGPTLNARADRNG
jgi:isoquinoline 1-oxidoreductase alpha subunit